MSWLLGWLALGALGARPFALQAQTTNAPVAARAADAYPLQPMDRLVLRIAEDPAAAGAAKAGDPEFVTVSALFEVDFPVSRGSTQKLTLNVKGKTLAQARQELKTLLDAEYYQNASVDLRLLDRTQRTGQILVYGAVRNNVIPIAPGESKTLLEAVLQAGPNEFARLSRVKLHRQDPATQKPQTRTIDVDAIKKSGDKSKDLPLQDGDRIEVPERSIVF